MDAIKAGLLAWTLEALVAISMLLVLKREEHKVLKRREKNENDN